MAARSVAQRRADRAYAVRHPERIAARRAAYYQKNRQRIKAKTVARLKAMSPETRERVRLLARVWRQKQRAYLAAKEWLRRDRLLKGWGLHG